MTRERSARGAGADEAGRNCPYCRFAIKPGIPVLECPRCRSLHHAECWSDNGGCSVLGCAAAPAAETRVLPSPPPPPAPQPGLGGRSLVVIGTLVAAILVGGGVAAAVILTRPDHRSGTESGNQGDRARPAGGGGPTDGGAAETPTQAQVEAFLRSYEQAYSTEDLQAMKALLAPDVVRDDNQNNRHQRGRTEALREYASQFARNTTYGYSLHDERIVRAPGVATVSATYLITLARSAPKQARINFRITDVAGTLQIENLQVEP